MDHAKDSPVHLRDYVWMKREGGAPEKVPVGPNGSTAEIEKRMNQGWSQVDEPETKGE